MQCIWNKAGFVLNIAWIKNGQVVRNDVIPTGQGNCSDDQGYDVCLSIVGGEIADWVTKASVAAVAIALGVATGGILTAGMAAGTAATGITAATAGTAAFASQLGMRGIPDPKGVFYYGTPSTDRYLDVWGTIWDPQTGTGGPIH